MYLPVSPLHVPISPYISLTGARDAEAEEARRQAEGRARRRAAAGLSWSARPAPQVEVEAVDRLEATFRSRLGLLSSSMCSSPRAAGWLLGGCDPTRSGQVLYPIPTPTQLN